METIPGRADSDLRSLSRSTVRGLERPDGLSTAREALLLELERALGTAWILFRDPGDGARTGGGEAWLEVREGRCRVGARAEAAARRLDFDWIRSLERGRLLRLSGEGVGRRARLAATGIRELLVFVEGGDAIRTERPPALVAAALPGALRQDVEAVELRVRTLFAVARLRSRLETLEAEFRSAQAARAAACALHDVRHELTVAALEIERERTIRTASPADSLDRCATAIGRAREVCDHALPGDRRRGDPHPVPLAELLRSEAAAARAASRRGTRVRVEVRCPEDLGVRTDRGRLSRAVRNVVMNAIEGSPDGAAVLLEARRGDGHLRIEVRDRGRGMAQAEQGRLLRFGASGGGGAGLGSESVELCLRAIGATLAIESALGVGTSAVLRIPERTPADEPSATRPSDPAR